MPLPFEEKLLLNVRQFANIAREKLPQGLSRDEVYDTMRARAESNRATMHNTNEIIRTDFIPLFDAPQTLTDAEADAYYDLARQFFTQSQVLDMGMAMQIHDALLHRARERGDVERIIRHLYWCGLLFLYWSNERYYPQAEVLFLEATSYEDQYFELGKETRLFFNRCLGNLYVTAAGARRHKGRPDYTPFFDAVQRATAFWQREDVRALDPDFPWAAFIVNSHQNTCAWVDMLRDQLRDDSTLARRVYESTMALYGGEAFFTGAPDTRRWPNARIVYMISVSKYHMGYLSAAETTARLKRLLTEMTPDDYSNDGMYRMLHVSIAMLEYMHHIPGISEQTLQAEELAVMDLVKRYFLRMPGEVDRFSLTSALAIFAAGVAFAQDRKRGLHELLRYTTFTHLPTHVHSLMTSMLMEAIAAYLLERQPDRLNGVCDTATAEEVMRRGDEVLSEIRMAGYAHDA
ncbi:MAG: hypothetical protein LBN04_07100, partial [Oscillospiraceae bacterium]|nr:hypothetical protein [Oscillospiraceae bacterium]